MTYLHAQPPRVECPTHGVRQVHLPWAEVRARFTALFERPAIDVLKETEIRGATRILRISWDEAWHILERAVARGHRAKRPRVTPHLGVDEKASGSWGGRRPSMGGYVTGTGAPRGARGAGGG